MVSTGAAKRPAMGPAKRSAMGRADGPVYRRRRALALLLLALMCLGLFSAINPLVSAASPVHVPEPVVVVVGPGETIWDLAFPHLPAGEDPRAFVARIVAFNDVDAGALRPGTVVRIPAP